MHPKNVVAILSLAFLKTWYFSGQSCTRGSDCGLPNSVCSSSRKCACDSIAGYEDVVGSNGRGTCTKSLGMSHKVI